MLSTTFLQLFSILFPKIKNGHVFYVHFLKSKYSFKNFKIINYIFHREKIPIYSFYYLFILISLPYLLQPYLIIFKIEDVFVKLVISIYVIYNKSKFFKIYFKLCLTDICTVSQTTLILVFLKLV